jgi:hypothetical protein
VRQHQWLEPSVWVRDGRGRSFTFRLPTDELIAAIEAVAEARSDEFILLQCSRSGVEGTSRSLFESKPISRLSLEGPWQYFIQSRAATPVLPAPTPLPGVGWPAVFACNGLISLHHPDPVPERPSAGRQSSIGIAHRVVNLKSNSRITHSDYDEIYTRLKTMLRSQSRAGASFGGHC